MNDKNLIGLMVKEALDPQTKNTLIGSLVGGGLGTAIGYGLGNNAQGAIVGGLAGLGLGGAIGHGYRPKTEYERSLERRQQRLLEQARNSLRNPYQEAGPEDLAKAYDELGGFTGIVSNPEYWKGVGDTYKKSFFRVADAFGLG